MNRKEMLEKISEVFFDVLDDDSIILNELTSSDDIDDWDSLNHIQLVVEIERKFNVRFTSSEINEWENIGEMMNCILNKNESRR